MSTQQEALTLRAKSRRGLPLHLLALLPLLCLLTSLAVEAQVQGVKPTVRREPPKVEPPDGKWLVDEEGLEYFEMKIPRGKEGRDYIWASENVIRVPPGVPFYVLRKDEDSLWLKYTKPVFRRSEGLESPTGDDPEPAPITGEPTVRIDFEPFDRGLPTAGQWRHGFDLVDMNGDGELDLVHGPPRKGQPRPAIFLGNGRGDWKPWKTRFPDDVAMDYGDIEVADFNDDGHQDIALAMHLTGLAVLVGDGKGGFQDWSEGLDRRSKDHNQSWTSRALVASDLNGDGRVDLAALGEGMEPTARATSSPESTPSKAGGVKVYFNLGDGRWQSKHMDSYVFGDDITVGDFDGDGGTDIVTASHTVYGHHILNLWQEDGAWALTPLDPLPVRSLVYGVAVLDLDGDGANDLVLGGLRRVQNVWFSEISVYFRNEDGTMERKELASKEAGEGVTAIDVGDLDGDGRLDIAAGTGTAELWMFLGRPGRTFERVANTLTDSVPRCSIYELALRDLDRDGRDELIVAFSGEDAVVPTVGLIEGCKDAGSIHAWTPGAVEALAAVQ